MWHKSRNNLTTKNKLKKITPFDQEEYTINIRETMLPLKEMFENSRDKHILDYNHFLSFIAETVYIILTVCANRL